MIIARMPVAHASPTRRRALSRSLTAAAGLVSVTTRSQKSRLSCHSLGVSCRLQDSGFSKSQHPRRSSAGEPPPSRHGPRVFVSLVHSDNSSAALSLCLVAFLMMVSSSGIHDPLPSLSLSLESLAAIHGMSSADSNQCQPRVSWTSR